MITKTEQYVYELKATGATDTKTNWDYSKTYRFGYTNLPYWPLIQYSTKEFFYWLKKVNHNLWWRRT